MLDVILMVDTVLLNMNMKVKEKGNMLLDKFWDKLSYGNFIKNQVNGGSISNVLERFAYKMKTFLENLMNVKIVHKSVCNYQVLIMKKLPNKKLIHLEANNIELMTIYIYFNRDNTIQCSK